MSNEERIAVDGREDPAPGIAAGGSGGSAGPESGRVIAGVYRLRGLLGQGGMARVYEADHLRDGHRVALKLVHAELGANAVVRARFEREARAAAQAGHPHVVGVHAIGRDDGGAPFLVMELVRGTTLHARLRAEPMLEVARACGIARQLLEALGAVHARGVVHRDLKPENVLLAVRDAEPDFVKLCDFGIATFVEARGRSELTPAGRTMATPHYASPEQLAGSRGADPAVDLYAVGVMLYEMIAGLRPFDAPDLPALLAQIRADSPAPLRVFRRDVPPGLDALLARALGKSAASRPPSAAAWLAALRPFCAA